MVQGMAISNFKKAPISSTAAQAPKPRTAAVGHQSSHACGCTLVSLWASYYSSAQENDGYILRQVLSAIPMRHTTNAT